MEEASILLETHLIAVTGAPAPILFDQEFDNDYFFKMLQKHGIKPKTRPARTHSKIGSVKSGKFALRQIFLRILKD